MEESILFLCAHNDDQIIGAGGTIAKYAKAGKKIVTVVFSYGETSLPHIQKKITRKIRVLESKKASKLLGESELYYLGLTEGRFRKEIEEKNIHSKIEAILKRVKPKRIFTHSLDDPHPDHRAIYSFTQELVDKTHYKGEIYTFNVWNLFLNFRKRNLPKMVVDIKDTFRIKVEALKMHKSQKLTLFMLLWSVYAQAIINGLNSNYRYAEVFYRIR